MRRPWAVRSRGQRERHQAVLTPGGHRAVHMLPVAVTARRSGCRRRQRASGPISRRRRTAGHDRRGPGKQTLALTSTGHLLEKRLLTNLLTNGGGLNRIAERHGGPFQAQLERIAGVLALADTQEVTGTRSCLVRVTWGPLIHSLKRRAGAKESLTGSTRLSLDPRTRLM